jgi:hypothetical protein
LNSFKIGTLKISKVVSYCSNNFGSYFEKKIYKDGIKDKCKLYSNHSFSSKCFLKGLRMLAQVLEHLASVRPSVQIPVLPRERGREGKGREGGKKGGKKGMEGGRKEGREGGRIIIEKIGKF